MVSLRKMTADDLPLFKKWLLLPHVERWFNDPEDWISEVQEQHGRFSWIHHFIVMHDGIAVGFCQYYALRDSNEVFCTHEAINSSYSIDYCIGEANYLKKGLGKQIVKCLIEKILSCGDAENILVQPHKDNEASRNLLLSCGFKYDSEADVFVMALRRKHAQEEGL